MGMDRGGLFLPEDRLRALGKGDPAKARSEILALVKRMERDATYRPPEVAPSDVRLAEPEDRDPLAELMTVLHGENGMFSLSPPKLDRLLDRFYEREGAIIGVIGEIGGPVASIYLSIAQPADYTDDWALIEVFSFVHPDHRRSNYAHQLIAYAKKMSASVGLPLCIGILSTTRMESKVRLYDQLLPRVGAYYLCRPNEGALDERH